MARGRGDAVRARVRWKTHHQLQLQLHLDHQPRRRDAALGRSRACASADDASETAQVARASSSGVEDGASALRRACAEAARDGGADARRRVLELAERAMVGPRAERADMARVRGRWSLLASVAASAVEADQRRRREGVVGGALVDASGSGGRAIDGTSTATNAGSWFLRSKGNFQDIDLDLDRGAGTAENRAEFAALGGSTRLVVSLRGECSLDPAISNRLHVRFREVEIALGSLRPLRASLDAFEPRGWIDTAFVDDDLRVGRGDKGSVFVAARRR